MELPHDRVCGAAPQISFVEKRCGVSQMAQFPVSRYATLGMTTHKTIPSPRSLYEEGAAYPGAATPGSFKDIRSRLPKFNETTPLGFCAAKQASSVFPSSTSTLDKHRSKSSSGRRLLETQLSEGRSVQQNATSANSKRTLLGSAARGAQTRIPSSDRIPSSNLSSTPSNLDAEKKLQNFRYAERAGRTICVCGASAYWERERIAIMDERGRLRKEFDNLRSAKEELTRKKYDVETLSQDLEQRLAMITVKEKQISLQQEKQAKDTDKIVKGEEELKRAKIWMQEQLEHTRTREKELEGREARISRRIADLKAESDRLDQERVRLSDEAEHLATSKAEQEAFETKLLQRQREVDSSRKEAERMQSSLDQREADVKRREQQLLGEEEQLKLKESELAEREQQLQVKEDNVKSESLVLDQLSDSVQQQETKVREAEARLDRQMKDLRRDLETLDEARSEVESRARKLESEWADLRNRRAQLEDKQTRLAEQEDLLRAETRALTERKVALESEKEEFQQSLQEHAKRVAEMDMQRKLHEQSLERQSLRENSLKTKEEELFAREAEAAKEKQELEEKKLEVQEMERKVGQREEEVERLTRQLAEREATLQSKEGKDEFRRRAMREAEELKSEYELRSEGLMFEIATLEDEKRRFSQYKDSVENQLKLREEEMKRYEADLRTRDQNVRTYEQILSTRLEEEGAQLKNKLKTVPTRPPTPSFRGYGNLHTGTPILQNGAVANNSASLFAKLGKTPYWQCHKKDRRGAENSYCTLSNETRLDLMSGHIDADGSRSDIVTTLSARSNRSTISHITVGDERGQAKQWDGRDADGDGSETRRKKSRSGRKKRERSRSTGRISRKDLTSPPKDRKGSGAEANEWPENPLREQKGFEQGVKAVDRDSPAFTEGSVETTRNRDADGSDDAAAPETQCPTLLKSSTTANTSVSWQTANKVEMSSVDSKADLREMGSRASAAVEIQIPTEAASACRCEQLSSPFTPRESDVHQQQKSGNEWTSAVDGGCNLRVDDDNSINVASSCSAGSTESPIF